MNTLSIIPGLSIDKYCLNWTKQDLIPHLNKNYKIANLSRSYLLNYKQFSFWIKQENDKIYQIGVKGEYAGKLFGKIGIGSTLSDVQKYFGDWKEELNIYIIANCEGVCFEISDNDTEEELEQDKMPISAIYIYDPKDVIWKLS